MTTKTDTFYIILPEKTSPKVLLLQKDNGWTLPYCEVAVSDEMDLMDTGLFNKMLREHLEIDATMLYALDTMDTESNIKIAAFENRIPEWTPPGKAYFLSHKELENLIFTRPILKSVLETWFTEAKDDTVENFMPWSKMGWFDEAAAWIMNRLHKLGINARSSVEQVKSFYTGGTLRVNTDIGYIYFKAVSHVFIREIEITQMLAKWFPARVSAPLAVDSERRWMLVQDIGGAELSEISEIEVWEEAFRAYAQLQMDSLKFLDELLNGPFYDYRIRTMISAIDSVIMDAPSLLQGYHECLNETEVKALLSLSPQFKSLCAEIESYNVPCALDHGDFHDGNIRITQNGPVFYDWAWSCVTHPFLGAGWLLHKVAKYSSAISNARTRFQNAYLEMWTDYEPLARLRELFDIVEQWKTLHAVLIDAEWVSAIQKEISHRPLLRYSFTEWSLRKRQYYLAKVLRRLFNIV